MPLKIWTRSSSWHLTLKRRIGSRVTFYELAQYQGSAISDLDVGVQSVNILDHLSTKVPYVFPLLISRLRVDSAFSTGYVSKGGGKVAAPIPAVRFKIEI